MSFTAQETCPVRSSGSCPASLMPDTTYQQKITTGVKNLSDNTLQSETSKSFTTKARPSVISSFPDNSSTNWSRSIKPTLTFDKPLKSSTVDNTTVSLSPAPIGGFTVKFENKTTITIQPNGYLEENTTYTVTLDANSIAGFEEEILIGQKDNLTFRTGESLWKKLLGTSEDDYGQSLTVDSSNNIYVTGSTWGKLDGNSSTGNADIFLVKYNSSGVKQWTKQLGTSSDDSGLGVSVDSSNNLYITGLTRGGFDGKTNSGKGDIFIPNLSDS